MGAAAKLAAGAADSRTSAAAGAAVKQKREVYDKSVGKLQALAMVFDLIVDNYMR